MDAALIAALDQERAGLNRQLDLLIDTFNGLCSERGTEQATCDITALLAERFPHVTAAAFAAVAIRRLAEVDGA